MNIGPQSARQRGKLAQIIPSSHSSSSEDVRSTTFEDTRRVRILQGQLQQREHVDDEWRKLLTYEAYSDYRRLIRS